VLPTSNCETTNLLLDKIFDNEKQDGIGVSRYNGKKGLMKHYQLKKKKISVDSVELQVLYPRQNFKLMSDGDELKVEIEARGKSFSSDSEPLPVCKSHGNRYEANEKIYGGRKKEAFAYRCSGHTFFAPQTPGLYYLYVPLKEEHYLVEIEVHGFKQKVIE
jgi:hypothetical protein